MFPTEIDGVDTPQTFNHAPVFNNYPSIPTEGIPLPPPSSYPTPLPSGIWQLKTINFKKCGYIVILSSRDRMNWNSSGYSAMETLDSVGFCIVEPT